MPQNKIHKILLLWGRGGCLIPAKEFPQSNESICHVTIPNFICFLTVSTQINYFLLQLHQHRNSQKVCRWVSEGNSLLVFSDQHIYSFENICHFSFLEAGREGERPPGFSCGVVQPRDLGWVSAVTTHNRNPAERQTGESLLGSRHCGFIRTVGKIITPLTKPLLLSFDTGRSMLSRKQLRKESTATNSPESTQLLSSLFLPCWLVSRHFEQFYII